MKFGLRLIFFTSLILLTVSAQEILRTEDLEDLYRVTIYEENGERYIKADSLSTGDKFGPTAIYQGISRGTIDQNIRGNISLEGVDESAIYIRIPMLEGPVGLGLTEQSPEDKRFNLQDILNGNLRRNDRALQGQINALQKEIAILKKRQFFGVTTPDDWINYSEPEGIMTTVDISDLNLKETPHVQISLNGKRHHWTTLGGSSIYGLDNKKFDVYIKFSDNSPLTVQNATEDGWYLSYTVTSRDL